MPDALTDELIALRKHWTDRYITVHSEAPDLKRFAQKVGRVITVNAVGKAIVDFADGAWYDIPLADGALQIVVGEDSKTAFDTNANSAQAKPVRQG